MNTWIERRNKMSKEEIIAKLKEVFKLVITDGADADAIALDADIMTGLGVNSIGLIYLIVGIEKVFKIDMSDVTFNTFKVVGDVVDYIYNKVN